MNRLAAYAQAHPALFKGFLWGYIIFAGCFTFPLWSERFPLDLMKAYLFLASYGVIGLSYAGAWGPKRGWVVYLQTAGFTIIGLLCRYLLEFGEVSNTYNFTWPNTLLYLFAAPFCTVAVYYFVIKRLLYS